MIRKIISVVSAAVLALSIFGCASSGGGSSSSGGGTASAPPPMPKGLSGVPQFVNDAFLNASEDVIIGIGTYAVGNDPRAISRGKTFAEQRARTDISRQLESIVKSMITDYSASSEVDPSAVLSFQEEISQTLSKNTLNGARTIAMNTDDNGILWLVMEYSKSAAKETVNQAQAAAKLAVPAAAAFDALSRMDNAFDAAGKGDPTTTVNTSTD